MSGKRKKTKKQLKIVSKFQMNRKSRRKVWKMAKTAR